MNIIKMAMEKVFGKGTSKAALLRREKANRSHAVGTRNQNENASRQAMRASLRDEAYAQAAVAGDTMRNASNQPLPRKERRQIARAIAAKRWRAMKIDAAAA